MSQSHVPHILNLSNSIIGVTILAMPFCFKECGIILGTILLFFCTWLTLSSCQMLMKAGLSSKKRSYGYLAYYTHGSPGKIAVEVGMIGLQLGTLVAQVVIIGDLGPAIISKFTGIENSSKLRTALIIMLCMGVGLPLGLLKNLSAISKASTLCICFYGIFVVYIISLSVPNLIAANWYDRVNLWKTEGLFKCLPIFSFAFGCQTQLFLLYDSLVEPSLKGINSIISSAVNMCTVSYLLVGFFGYISFCDTDITGDIINHLPSTFSSEILKLGFVISIAITFPLIIFPCRSCLYTLFFPERPKVNEDIEQRPVIPELHFKVLTVIIVLIAVITGILVPNVEFVLAINGATMGTLICYIFPAMFFLRVMTGSSDGKNVAQFVFICGFTIMLLCTYTTLNSQDKSHGGVVPVKPEEIMKPTMASLIKRDKPTVKGLPADKTFIKDQDKVKEIKESRVEPPNPREPVENDSESEKLSNKDKVNISMKNKPEKSGGQLEILRVIDKKADKETKVEEKREETKDVKKKEENLDKQNEILQELKKQHEEQQKLIDEQKKILAELKEHQEVKHKSDKENQDKQQPNVANGVPVVENNQQQPVAVNQEPVLQNDPLKGNVGNRESHDEQHQSVEKVDKPPAKGDDAVKNKQENLKIDSGKLNVATKGIGQNVVQPVNEVNVEDKKYVKDPDLRLKRDVEQIKITETKNTKDNTVKSNDKGTKVINTKNTVKSEDKDTKLIDTKNNVIKSKDTKNSNNKYRAEVNKEVNDEMKRRLLSKEDINNDLTNVIMKSR